jgi:hypothetical protein
MKVEMLAWLTKPRPDSGLAPTRKGVVLCKENAIVIIQSFLKWA